MRVMVVHGKGMQETREEGERICSGGARRSSRRLRKNLLWEGWGGEHKKKMKGLDIVGKSGSPEEVRKGMGKKSLISGILENFPCGSLGRLGQWSAVFQSPDLTKIPDISPPSHLQSTLNSTLNSMIGQPTKSHHGSKLKPKPPPNMEPLLLSLSIPIQFLQYTEHTNFNLSKPPCQSTNTYRSASRE